MTKAIVAKPITTLPSIAANSEDFVLVSDTSEGGAFARVIASDFPIADSFSSYSVVTTVGNPGTDTNVPSEQAVREIITTEVANAIPDNVSVTNLITNGTFDTDYSGWTTYSSGISVVSGRLRMVPPGLSNPLLNYRYVTQTVSVMSGYYYAVTYSAYPQNTDAYVMVSANQLSGSTSSDSHTTAGTYKFIFLATQSAVTIQLNAGASASQVDYGELDNVRVERIVGLASTEDISSLYTGTGDYLKADGTLGDPSLEAGTMVYPAAGVARSTGTSWTTSYTVGVGANNLVQLNSLAQLPAVSAALLTNFPTLNQNTTGTAANVTGTVAVANGGTGSTTADGARNSLGVTGIIGIGVSDTTLGSFTGTTIPDAQTIKQAIQVLETALEAFDTDFLRSTDNATITGNWTFSEEVTFPAGQTLPPGGTLNQILVMGESGPVWMDVEDHPSDIITGEPTPV
jgi:hypothetical protein